jgi:DNA-binding NarL/FixJ family response regulator
MRRRQSFATIIVGQCSLIREGVVRILRSANFRILASMSCFDEVSGKIPSERLLFLIIHTGDDFDFVAGQIELFTENHPDARIAVVADRYRPDELVSAFRAGANGYLVDVVTCDVFIRSLELVMMGETVLPPEFLSYVLGREEDHMDDCDRPVEESEAIFVTASEAMAPQLSPRETLILRCLIDGDSNKSIARKMDITEATVKVHVKAILRKIRVHNRTQAAIWGMNNGWSSQTTDPIAPQLPSGTPKQLPNAVGPSPTSSIEQSETPTSAGAISQANHADLPRFESHIRKYVNLKTDIAVRSRKQ